MFVPKSKEDKKAEKAAQKKALNDVRGWCLSCMAPELQEGLTVDVNEVACGDPSCAPVDTIVTLIWSGNSSPLPLLSVTDQQRAAVASSACLCRPRRSPRRTSPTTSPTRTSSPTGGRARIRPGPGGRSKSVASPPAPNLADSASRWELA